MNFLAFSMVSLHYYKNWCAENSLLDLDHDPRMLVLAFRFAAKMPVMPSVTTNDWRKGFRKTEKTHVTHNSDDNNSSICK